MFDVRRGSPDPAVAATAGLPPTPEGPWRNLAGRWWSPDGPGAVSPAALPPLIRTAAQAVECLGHFTRHRRLPRADALPDTRLRSSHCWTTERWPSFRASVILHWMNPCELRGRFNDSDAFPAEGGSSARVADSASAGGPTRGAPQHPPSEARPQPPRLRLVGLRPSLVQIWAGCQSRDQPSVGYSSGHAHAPASAFVRCHSRR